MSSKDSVPTTELVDRCLAGDQVAVAELIDRYKPMVFGLCFRMLGHRQDAEDVTQESFVRAIRALERWDNTRDFRPWMLAIAGNRCRTHLSKRRRRAQPMELVEDLPDHAPDTESADNLAEEVHLALVDVREEYRQAFLLFHEEELSYAEIGEALDCPVGTVKTWVHRARRELIERLQRRGVIHEVRHES